MKKMILASAVTLFSLSAPALTLQVVNQTEADITAHVTMMDTNGNDLKNLGQIVVGSKQTFSRDLGVAANSDRYLFRWSVTGVSGQELCLEGVFPAFASETFAIGVDGSQQFNLVGCSAGRR